MEEGSHMPHVQNTNEPVYYFGNYHISGQQRLRLVAYGTFLPKSSMLAHSDQCVSCSNTVNSRYLELQGTGQNMSSYQ